MSRLVSNPEFEYLGVYIPVSEYMNYFNGKWPREVVEQTIKRIIASISRERLLRGLGSLRSEIEADDKCETVLNEYCSRLDANQALVLREILKSSYPKRVLYTPQIVVQACNFGLSHDSKDDKSDIGGSDRVTALILCHLIGELNGSNDENHEKIQYGSEEFDVLTLNFLANHFFHAEDDRMNVIARTRRLWKSQNVRASDSLDGITTEDIFHTTIGVSIDIRMAAALLLIGSVGHGSRATALIRTKLTDGEIISQNLLSRFHGP